jgi:hypothetical protein
VAEYLAALEAETGSQDETERGNGDGSDGGREPRSERKPPKVISPSDPSSAWTAKANKRVLFGYHRAKPQDHGAPAARTAQTDIRVSSFGSSVINSALPV